ncbi:protein SABRE-like [Gastrolobium bilobum]|uniref:protein SABRE-like n=1 Tax=Gastrolobium bilobum TaxID=150636 RepID=UPI002AB0F76B|nr:protein SABRE-like [Gastrolobium bilobum]
MAVSPANFVFAFLLFCVTLTLVFIFASGLLAWILSRILGASVGFCVGGCNSLRDVVVKFKKGAVESVSIGEIKLSLRHSLVKLCVSFNSWDPKLQVLICNLEVSMRPSNKSPGKKKTRKSSARPLDRGKWMIIGNIARYLSVSVTDLVLKTPKFTFETTELNVDISKDGGSVSDLSVRVQILPIVVHIGEPQVSCDLLSNVYGGGCSASSQASVAAIKKPSAHFICEKFSVSCEFGHDREIGIIVKNVGISIGEVTVNLNEGLLVKRKSSSESPSSSNRNIGTSMDSISTKQPSKKQQTLAGYSSLFPEKVSFNLPKLNVSFTHREYGISVESNITGIQLESIKSRSTKDVGESTCLDFQLEFSEIHLLREAGTSTLEILKLNLVSFVYVPIQSISPIRAEIEIKLGGLQCNIIMSRLKPWLLLHLSKKKKMVLREEASVVVKPKSTDSKTIITWKCNLLAPKMTIMVFNVAGSPVYHGCLQSSHLFANNISNMGTTVHLELGELILRLADEYQDCLKESFFGLESNSGSIMHITKVSLDWGKKDMKSSEEDGSRYMLGLSVDVTGMGIYLTFKRIESFISTAISFQSLLKSLSPPKKKLTESRGHLSKTSKKGIQILKCNVEQCSVYVLGETGLENTVVPDPKRVNYGSQGGRVIINVSADGTPRNANIMSTISNEYQKLKYSIFLEIFHFKLCMNKEKQSTQVELERARSIYQEYMEENRPVTKVALFDMQNAKFVQRLGGLKENAACSLFSATDITVRWEPDLHLSLIELVLQLKSVVHNRKLQEQGNEHMEEVSYMRDANCKNEATEESGHPKKKKESIFAVDVEMLNISAELGDGVDAMVQVQSIFSENARIGVLLEGLMLSFNGARIFKSSRMQISRIPSISANASDAKGSVATTWDWVIQGLDVHICIPYRLQLRAIDDAFEDMLRGLKLIIVAKNNLVFPVKKESSKVKKPSSAKFGCIKFFIRKLTADIEEEPIQGWLDEHYQLLKKEAGELAVRLNFLDEFIQKAKQDPKSTDDTNNSSQERKVNFNVAEDDVNNSPTIESMQEEIYKQSFQSYYQACQNLVLSEGSGACKDGFQAGFKPSSARSSLLTISALDLDISLTKIGGGDDGMIEVLRKLDPVCLEYDIPFSRLYGANILLSTGSLVVQLRNYPYPLFSGSSGKCEGCLVLAQQATSFQPQILQDVYVGRWRKVSMLRSASGTTPPMKTYSNLPIHFQKGEVSFGVGYEPVFADVSYAFTVVLRRANLSVRNPGPLIIPPKKERSLPWWDDMRNYIHGRISLLFSETKWNILASTNPYEKLDKLKILTSSMEFHQSDGHVLVCAKDFKVLLSSLESLANKRGSKIPTGVSGAFLEAPVFTLEVTMDWDCDSGNPLNHYLFALPIEGETREKVFDPFRSISLSLRWNLSFGSFHPSSEKQCPSSIARASIEGDATVHHPPDIFQNVSLTSPTVKLGAHDLAWIVRFWNLNYIPPHKLRTFSRWPRFGVPRLVRSGNLSLDKVMTEFMIRIDSTPVCIKNMPLHDDDPAKGLTFMMTKLKFELCFSRGKQKYTFESKRDLLDLVYQGIDLHMPKAFLIKEDYSRVAKLVSMTPKNSQSASENKIPSEKGYLTQKNPDDGFLLSCDYFTIRRQSPKADPARLVAWHEAGRRNVEKTDIRSECEHGSGTDEHIQSDPSDDDGYNVVIADNCQRVFVYGLKLLWTIENRDAICFWVGGLSKAFEPAKPSPSRQYAQRKLFEDNKQHDGAETHQNDDAETRQHDGDETHQHDEAETHQHDGDETHQDDGAETCQDDGAETCQDEVSNPLVAGNISDSPSSQTATAAGLLSSPPHSVKVDDLPSDKNENTDDSKEGIRHFMVNVIEPQFNLHSEDAHGRFLLAAVSGRILAQSFHSILHVGHEMIEQALGTTDGHIGEYQPEIAWKRMELSVMLERVQAHVAPTDVDLGAGVQWLPKILRGSPKVMRTGALLERVFMPCDMYFQYTRHKGGTPELKVKPLKELKFNSHNITATMTSRQFQVMLDVLNNLLFARLPKPQKSSLSLSVEDDEVVEEEADEVVPDGVEEVELAKINLEKKEREQKLLLDDIRKLSVWCDPSRDVHQEKEADLWMIGCGSAMLVQELKRELISAQKSKKEAYASLRMALQKAAQLRLMEKEKNKSPSYAMRISMHITKVVWSMLLDGKSFAEAEINDMIYDFDRDYKDVGVSQFTTKYFVFRNCLPNAKSDMILSAWNPPPEWGKKVMLQVDAKQGAPKDGSSPFELFQVEIYPLKIHLTETMYRMMWGYFFPEEERDSQRRQEVWKVSTAAGARRVKKGSSVHEASASSGHSTKESKASSKSSISAMLFPATSQSSVQVDSAQVSILMNSNPSTGSTPELRRTSSSDRTWEETVAESVADELVLQSFSSQKNGPFGSNEQQDEATKNKSKDSKGVKAGLSSLEEEKVAKSHEEKRSRPQKIMEFHNIKISQVELCVTYEGQRFVINDLKILMDQFHRVEFTGTWRRLFSRVKKHIIWGVLKSVTGMQGKKFKDKGQSQPTGAGVTEIDLNFSDNEGQVGISDKHPPSWPKRPSDGAGDGFVTSVRGIFSTQRRKAKAFVLKTMRGDAENEFQGDWSENDVEISPFARQLTIIKAKKLIKRHTKKFHSKGQKGSSSQQTEALPSSPRETTPFDSDSSSGSSPYEAFHE